MPVESGKLKLNLKGKQTVSEGFCLHWLAATCAPVSAGGTPWVDKKKKKKKPKVIDANEDPSEEEQPSDKADKGPTTTSEQIL